MNNQADNSAERRRYIRMPTIFPVEYQLYSSENDKLISPLKQGFTRDISAGGLCLEVKGLDNGFIPELQQTGTQLVVYINVPFHREPIRAKAELRWFKKIENKVPSHYLIGLEYVNISNITKKRIISYAKSLERRPKIIALSIIALLLIASVTVFFIKREHVSTLRELAKVEKALVAANEQQEVLGNKIRSLNMKHHVSKKKILVSNDTIEQLQDKLDKIIAVDDQLSDELIAQKIELEQQLQRQRDESQTFTQQLAKLTEAKNSLHSELDNLRKLSEVKIIKVQLTNGNSVTGQLMSLSNDKINIKVGMGSIGIDRNMLRSIKEVTGAEKINIQQQWYKEEQAARKAEEKRKDYIDEQRAKGLVRYNGKWMKREKMHKLEVSRKDKEKQIASLIAKQRLEGIGDQKQVSFLKRLLREQEKPIISIKDGRIYKNGRLFFVKGIAYGIEYPGTAGGTMTFKNVPLQVFEKDFQMMKEAGINTIRTYQPLPDDLLDLAEKYNIMVIENLCALSDNTDFKSRVHLNIFREQVKRYVLKHKNRKCLLMWSLWNDAPWAWGSSGNVLERYKKEEVNEFLKELYDTVKQYDTTHPVTAANALDISGEDLGWGFLDVIGLNVYIGGYDWFASTEAKRQVARIKTIEQEYQKPVIVLETGFSTFVKGIDQAEVLGKQIMVIGKNSAGITIFQWADGWQKAGNKDVQDAHIEEYWGIVDGYRIPKSGYSAVSKLFNQIPTESYGYEN